jgi:hypothetical protein|tara:strand:- start:424 stop:630 length:207 start_codon:yes stop_codon:yes gene_type:complete
MKMEQTIEPALKVQMELDAHEKECAMFRELVHGKLDGLDKRMWRLEAMIMCSTLAMVAMVVTVFMGMK